MSMGTRASSEPTTLLTYSGWSTNPNEGLEREGDRDERDYHPAAIWRDRKLPRTHLLRSRDHARRGRTVAPLDRRALFGDARALARCQGRPARPGHVSGRVREGGVRRAGAVADAQPWTAQRAGASEHDQPAPRPSRRSAVDRFGARRAWRH